MALTKAQARDSHIIDSIALFLDRNLKQAYDAEVSTSAFPAPLTIERGKPDDLSQKLTVPKILIDTIGGSDKARQFEMGTNVCYRHMNLVLYCFPATASGSPSNSAADLLKSYVRDAFGTQYIRLIDYTAVGLTLSNLIYCNDVAEMTGLGNPIERKATSTLAEEAHRFDVHIAIRYPVGESSAT